MVAPRFAAFYLNGDGHEPRPVPTPLALQSLRALPARTQFLYWGEVTLDLRLNQSTTAALTQHPVTTHLGSCSLRGLLHIRYGSTVPEGARSNAVVA